MTRFRQETGNVDMTINQAAYNTEVGHIQGGGKEDDSSIVSSIMGEASVFSSTNLSLIYIESVNSATDIMSWPHKTQTQASTPRDQSEATSPTGNYRALGERHDVNLLIPCSQSRPWNIGTGYLEHAPWARGQWQSAKEHSDKISYDDDWEDIDIACLVDAMMTENARKMLEDIAVMLEVHQYPRRDICNSSTRRYHVSRTSPLRLRNQRT